jgi:hypothetical protein
MKTWEEKIAESDLSFSIAKKNRRIILEFLDSLNIPNFYQHVLLNKILFFLSKLPNSGKSKIRYVLTRLYSSPTLKQPPLAMEIFIFTAKKDLELLELSIFGAIQSSINRIDLLTVVAPSELECEIHKVFQKLGQDLNLKFLSDEELLTKYELVNFKFVRPNIKMEVIKVLAALHSNSEAVLLIDGDTVILKERNWITSEKQLVLVAQEYTPEHINFDKKFLNSRNLSGLGFVTHHQVIRRSHLMELISESKGLLDFVNFFNCAASDFYLRSGSDFPSEWQLFGDYLLNRHPEKAVLTSFKNLGVSRKRIRNFLESSEGVASTEVSRLKKAVPHAASLSFHSYKG